MTRDPRLSPRSSQALGYALILFAAVVVLTLATSLTALIVAIARP